MRWGGGGGAYKSGGLLSAVYGTACKQVLRGALAVGREKEGELTTTSVEFENSYFEKGCRKKVHKTIPKGNMGYVQYTFPDTVAVKPTFVAFF